MKVKKIPKKYYIQEGDTLFGIAKKLGVSIEYLIKMNQHLDRHHQHDIIYY